MTTFNLKRLPQASLEAALVKAAHYRDLNQPEEAESIHITDNAIIPLKERVADDFYDPVRWLLRKVGGGGPRKEKAKLPVVDAEDLESTSAATPAAKARGS